MSRKTKASGYMPHAENAPAVVLAVCCSVTQSIAIKSQHRGKDPGLSPFHLEDNGFLIHRTEGNWLIPDKASVIG